MSKVSNNNYLKEVRLSVSPQSDHEIILAAIWKLPPFSWSLGATPTLSTQVDDPFQRPIATYTPLPSPARKPTNEGRAGLETVI